MQGASVHRDGQGKQGDQGGDFKYDDNETAIAASDNSMKDRENIPYLDHKEMKVELVRAFEHKDFGYMTDFNGLKEELKSKLSNSVQKIHTEQDDSCGGQKGHGSSICVTHEFDDKMVEEEVEHAFVFKNKKKKHRDSANEGHQEVYKNDNINDIKTIHPDPCALHTCKNLLPGKTLFNHAEESDINNFICIRKNKTCFRTLCDCIWNGFCLLPRFLCMDGNAALNDGPSSASREFTQDNNTENRHMILVQRDIQAFTVVANMPHQTEIAMAHTSGQVTLSSLDQVSGREATSASQSHELLMVVASGENADEKNQAKASAAEENFSRRQVPEESETLVQTQDEVSLESQTLGALTMDMGSPAFTVVANMPHQTEIAMAHTSGQVTLSSLDQVSGREATSASQSHELLMVVASGENADEKNQAKASAAEENFSRRQVPEESETLVQTQDEVSLESQTLGALTMDMGSPAFTVVANMPHQTEIAMAHTSGQVTLSSLDQVSGREATSASQSHELLMVVASGENADEKNQAKASAAEENFSRRQVPEESETLVQTQDEVSLESHTLGALTMDMGSPAFTVVANMPHQTEIAMAHTSGQVTLSSLDQVSGREATSASQSHELLMVVASGENADENNQAKASAAEENFSRRQVPEKSETLELKEHQQKPDIQSKIHQDQDELNSNINWCISKNWDRVYDLESCKPHSYINSTNYIYCIIYISVYVVALEPRQNDVSNLVTETSLPPTVYHSVARQVDGQNVLTVASQTVDGHPNNNSQEPQRGMDERINDPSNSPAFQCSDSDTGFTDVHLASGRVTEDAGQSSGLTLPSAPVHESDLNITSVELLRASDVCGMTPLPETRSQHSTSDTSCSFQTVAGRHASDLSQRPVAEQAADGNPFHIAAARSTQSEVNGINNKPASPVNSHEKNGDTGSIKLQAIRSTDPGNGSTTEPSYTVHMPTRTSNHDDSSANAMEMTSMNLASGEIRNTKEEASGRWQNETRGDATSIQETDSAQPRYPQYASRNQRMNSFQGWPATLRQRPQEMTECGFYYEGFTDCVRCFHCGVGLQLWMHEDDPWFEHARWSPSCFYVCKIKGNEFVSLVQSEIKIAEMEAARRNATGNDSSNNSKESADGKNKDMTNGTEETAIEHETNMNPDIFHEVMRQFQELYDSTICRICLDRKRSVVFLPCGHFGTCTWCSCFLQKCPFCRKLIVRKIKITDC